MLVIWTMYGLNILVNDLFINDGEDWHTEQLIPKRQGSLVNVGIMGFVFTNFQANNYGTSSGDDEGNSPMLGLIP